MLCIVDIMAFCALQGLAYLRYRSFTRENLGNTGFGI
jgi:hypothetical protein